MTFSVPLYPEDVEEEPDEMPFNVLLVKPEEAEPDDMLIDTTVNNS